MSTVLESDLETTALASCSLNLLHLTSVNMECYFARFTKARNGGGPSYGHAFDVAHYLGVDRQSLSVLSLNLDHFGHDFSREVSARMVGQHVEDYVRASVPEDADCAVFDCDAPRGVYWDSNACHNCFISFLISVYECCAPQLLS